MNDTWTVRASSGEYSEEADCALTALTQFVLGHPDDYVHAIACGQAAFLHAVRVRSPQKGEGSRRRWLRVRRRRATITFRHP
jgi:hypothetical protein